MCAYGADIPAFAFAYGLGNRSLKICCNYLCNGAILEHVDKALVAREYRGCSYCQPLYPSCLYPPHDHVKDIVAVSQVVMEAKGHSVLKVKAIEHFIKG